MLKLLSLFGLRNINDSFLQLLAILRVQVGEVESSSAPLIFTLIISETSWNRWASRWVVFDLRSASQVAHTAFRSVFPRLFVLLFFLRNQTSKVVRTAAAPRAVVCRAIVDLREGLPLIAFFATVIDTKVFVWWSRAATVIFSKRVLERLCLVLTRVLIWIILQSSFVMEGDSALGCPERWHSLFIIVGGVGTDHTLTTTSPTRAQAKSNLTGRTPTFVNFFLLFLKNIFDDTTWLSLGTSSRLSRTVYCLRIHQTIRCCQIIVSWCRQCKHDFFILLLHLVLIHVHVFRWSTKCSRVNSHLSQMFLHVLWNACHLVGREGLAGIPSLTTTTAEVRVSARIRFWVRHAWVKPLKVLGVLDWNVCVLDYDHKDVLHDWHYEENEHVHEQLSVVKVCKRHRMVCVKECITCLNREHGVKRGIKASKTFFELPHDAHREESNSNVNG